MDSSSASASSEQYPAPCTFTPEIWSHIARSLNVRQAARLTSKFAPPFAPCSIDVCMTCIDAFAFLPVICTLWTGNTRLLAHSAYPPAAGVCRDASHLQLQQPQSLSDDRMTPLASPEGDNSLNHISVWLQLNRCFVNFWQHLRPSQPHLSGCRFFTGVCWASKRWSNATDFFLGLLCSEASEVSLMSALTQAAAGLTKLEALHFRCYSEFGYHSSAIDAHVLNAILAHAQSLRILHLACWYPILLMPLGS